jgi:GT2 family glycosyltransferase
VIYGDEDIHHAGSRILPEFKPDWSPHLLSSRMYIGRAFVSASTCLRQFLSAMRQESRDWRHDFLLKVADNDIPVHHISRVVYHRKLNSGSIERELEQHLTRPEPSPGRRSALSGRKSVAVVICSRSPELVSKCLDSLNATAAPLIENMVVVAHEQAGANGSLRSAVERRGAVVMPFTGRFNFSLMNNLAVKNIASRHLLFLNDDVTASKAGWLERLLEQIEDRGAGIAGATLRYPSGLLQHSGIVAGSGDGVVHIGRFMRESVLWPWLLETRDVSAVTGACLCMPTELFRALGGFDTAFPNNYNDVDLCFRARATGRQVVCVATPGLIHAECASRQGIVRFEERHRFFRKWDALLAGPDPYYSPHLTPTEAIQFDLAGDNGFRALLSDDQDRQD